MAQGKIVYVGGEETARGLCADGATALDYGDNYVYPGFLEAHCHPGGAGARAIGQANLLPGKSLDKYVRITAEFVAANPGLELYVGANWMERDLQLGVENAKGSNEADKGANFLVSYNDPLAAEPQGFGYNKPSEVYFGGKNDEPMTAKRYAVTGLVGRAI